MIETAILAAMVAAGVALVVQGYLTIRGRRQAHAFFLERSLLETLALKDPARVNEVLGRLRLVYGFFLLVVGLWGLLNS